MTPEIPFRRRRPKPMLTLSRGWLRFAFAVGTALPIFSFFVGRWSAGYDLSSVSVYTPVSLVSLPAGESLETPIPASLNTTVAAPETQGINTNAAPRGLTEGERGEANGSEDTPPLGESFAEDEAEPFVTPPEPRSIQKYRESPPSGQYGVQVAAYPSLEEAENFIDTHYEALEVVGPIFIVQRRIGSQAWYRVRVGRFKRARAARRASRGLPTTLDSAMIVRYR